MNRQEKEAVIMAEMADKILMDDGLSGIKSYNPLFPHHILSRAKSIGGNMVINNYGTIMFNMAGTPQENGSYREIKRDITKDLYGQEDITIDSLYNLIQDVKGN